MKLRAWEQGRGLDGGDPLEIRADLVGALPLRKRHTSEHLGNDMFMELICRRGDGGKAHDLSQEGKTHQRRQDQLDDEASEWIFIGEWCTAACARLLFLSWILCASEAVPADLQRTTETLLPARSTCTASM